MKEGQNVATKRESQLREKERNRISERETAQSSFGIDWRDTNCHSFRSRGPACQRKGKLNVPPWRGLSHPAIPFPTLPQLATIL